MGPSGVRSTMFNDDKARVLAASDIVRVIGEQVSLRKKGREFVCVCPFHNDHNPSMYVVPHKQIYHCFVCQASGNVISFVMDYHKMGFREALEHLADRFGVTLSPPPSASRREPGAGGEAGVPEASRTELISANAVASEFFRLIYEHGEHGAAARGIMERRGVSAEMLRVFGIGAAPDKWDGLVLTAQKKGLELRPLLAAGLLRPRDSGGCFDMFRNRVMFPITDAVGRVVAFGGRRINEADEPKYINSPESGVFNKSATLYGLHQASAGIRATGTAIVTEGYMDTIACHQAGFTNAVATLGTALTSQSARVLERLCQQVILLFDGDDAGQRAADRAVEVFFTSRLDIKIATLAGARAAGLTTAKDPDELLKAADGSGAETMRAVLARSIDALEYRLDRIAARSGALSSTAKAELVTGELQQMVDLGLSEVSPIRQQVILRRLARIAGVDESTVRRAMPRTRSAGATPRGAPPGEPARDRAAPPVFKTAASHVLACVVSEPLHLVGLAESDAALIAPDRFEHPALRSLASRLVEVRSGGGAAPATFAELSASLDGPDEAAAVLAVAAVEEATQGDPARLSAHLARCLEEARKLDAKARALEQASPLDRLRRLQQLASGGSAAAATGTPGATPSGKPAPG